MKTNLKHTPGPWKVNQGRHGILGQNESELIPHVLIETNCIDNGPEACIALLGIDPNGNKSNPTLWNPFNPDGNFHDRPHTITDGEILANAKLLSAAPELLEAAQEALGMIQYHCGNNPRFQVVAQHLEKAIAKAANTL